MNIATLQGRAWDIAEAKGHHDALNQPEPDARCAALARLADVYTALNAVTQQVKRHGTGPVALEPLRHLTDTVIEAVLQWSIDLRTGDVAVPQHYATLARLVLIHTEVSEAMEVAHDAGLLAGELADILIRTGDLAEERQIALSAAVVGTMERNLARSMYYGTPQEGRA